VCNNLFEISHDEIVFEAECLDEPNVANMAMAKLVHTLSLVVPPPDHGSELFLEGALDVLFGRLVVASIAAWMRDPRDAEADCFRDIATSFSELLELLEPRVARLATVIVDLRSPNHAERIGVRAYSCSSSVAAFVTP
jgi:hypothetical protein